MDNQFSKMTDKELILLVRNVSEMKYGQGADLIEECVFRLMAKVFYEVDEK